MSQSEGAVHGREEGAGIGSKDEYGRQRSRVGRRQELHAEHGDEQDPDQPRAGPACHVLGGAVKEGEVAKETEKVLQSTESQVHQGFARRV